LASYQPDAKAVRVGRLPRLLQRIRQGHDSRQPAAASPLFHLDDNRMTRPNA
jgi:hypothetical protein